MHTSTVACAAKARVLLYWSLLQCVCCLHVKPLFLPYTPNDVECILIYIIHPTTSAHPVSVLILHPSEIQIMMWSQTTMRQRVIQTVAIHQDKASEILGVPGTRTQQNKPDHKKQRGTVGHFISAAMGLPRKRLAIILPLCICKSQTFVLSFFYYREKHHHHEINFRACDTGGSLYEVA